MRNATLPAGCDQQGRYDTRHEHWADAEWRETAEAQRPSMELTREPAEVLTLGDLFMVIWVVGLLALFVSVGPWL